MVSREVTASFRGIISDRLKGDKRRRNGRPDLGVQLREQALAAMALLCLYSILLLSYLLT